MTQPPTSPYSPPVVQISIDQVYQEVRIIHTALERIEAKLESMKDFEPRIRDLENARIHERLPDFERRLRSLEERRLPHSLFSVMAAMLGTAALIWQAFMMK